MGRVNLCWTCTTCASDNRLSLDPWDDEETINWDSEASFGSRCVKCGTKHQIELKVSCRIQQED